MSTKVLEHWDAPEREVKFATDALAGSTEWLTGLKYSRNTLVRLTPKPRDEQIADRVRVFIAESEGEAPLGAHHLESLAGAHAYAVRNMGLWVGLLVLGMFWSVLTGMAFALTDFWLDPAAGLLGCLGLGVIGISLATASRTRRA